MTYDIRWYDANQTIVHVRYPRGWTWDDFHLIADAVQQLRDAEPKPRVDIIADMSDGMMPRGGFSSHSVGVIRDNDVALGFVVVVTSNPVIRTLTQIGSQLSPKTQEKYRVTGTVAEAVTLIEEERAKAK